MDFKTPSLGTAGSSRSCEIASGTDDDLSQMVEILNYTAAKFSRYLRHPADQRGGTTRLV
jgi:hypothetical protein